MNEKRKMVFIFFLIQKRLNGIKVNTFERQKHVVFFLFLLFSVLVTDLRAQEQRFTIQDGKKVAEIPFTNINNLIVLPVMLENKVPLWFILDTGVRTTILTDRIISDMLGLKYIRKYTLQGAGGFQQVEAMLAQGTSMNLPGVQLTGQQMLVLEEDYLELSNQLGMQVHGILGYEIFKRFVVKIDYSSTVITLYEPESFKPGRGYVRLPLEIEDTKPYLLCEVVETESKEKKVVKLMVDTGASHALLLHQGKENQQFTLPEKTIFGHLGRGLAGDVVGQIGRIHGFDLGRFSFEDVLTSFPEDSAYQLKEWTSRAGTLGGDILSRFTVIFNYGESAIYLKKNETYRDPFVYNKTGLNIVAVGDNLKTFRVVSVRKDSPAGEAGIQPGDVLLRVNGRSAQYLSLAHIINLFRSRDGRKIRLKLKRGDEEIKTSFRLKDAI